MSNKKSKKANFLKKLKIILENLSFLYNNISYLKKLKYKVFIKKALFFSKINVISYQFLAKGNA